MAQLCLVRSMLLLVLMVAAVFSSCAAKPAAGPSFGEYYRHTRWIDRETHVITVDAYSDRLVISQRGKADVVVRGRWGGRGFWRASEPEGELPYFGVAHEGIDAGFFGDRRLEKLHFKRVQRDPT